MSNVPNELKYTRDHEWVRVTGEGVVRVGITDHAQKELGDIVFAELPTLGNGFSAGEPFGTLESVKAVTEVYAPVSGEVTALNDELGDSPERVNEEPYGDGWLIEIKFTDKSELDRLLSDDGYESYISEGSE
ncbi:glycine cleavage system protein GcvH [Streptomyces sp. NBC_01571]|uniref:glycine cleavage system protein GcvH n=1 Tax=Streptomyces sp. NBC_01571 TaxID=2975883 RepID=UPI00224D9DB5|nr:glycine cleavage system protein GcvH [Streptomyces sp. NBC_01571]MCX4580058.1 glycine cleavage system protein GcvH [Streptomyces sp. NBC_01571]